MARLTPKKDVVRRLFALSGNRCAFPGCRNHLINETGVLIAEICHIAAAEPGGERYDQEHSDEDRRAYENLLLFCHPHHKVTDDINTYTIPVLRKMKEDHEKLFLDCQYEIPKGWEETVFNEFDSKFNALFQIAHETLDAVRTNNETGKRTNETVERIEVMLAQVLQQQQSIALDYSRIYAQQLDFIKGFRKEKKPKTALNALLKYKDEHWDKIGGELQYKVLANLGTLYFELGRKADGAKQLIELKNVPFESGGSLAYLCLGYAILGMKPEFESAFRRAKSLESDNSNLWIAYIHIQDASIPAEVIQKEIPESILHRPEIIYTLGEVFFNRGEEQKGLELLQQRIEGSEGSIEDDWHITSMIESLRLLHLAKPIKIVFNEFTDDDLAGLRKSQEVLTSIWNYIAETEFAASAWNVVLNRGIINKILGNDLAAEQDLEDAWRLSKNFFAFKDLFLHYIDTNRLNKAESILSGGKDAIVDAEDEIEFATCEARLYSEQKDPEKAVELLAAMVEKVEHNQRLKLFDLITLIYFQCGAFGKAIPYAQRMIDDHDDRPEGYIQAGICYRMQHQNEAAVLHFDNAMARVQDGDARMPYIYFRLGNEYENLGEHEKSIACFEKITDITSFGEAHRKLLYGYYNAEEFQNAIDLCLQAKNFAPNDALVNEILFRSYQDIGAVEKAKSVLEVYLQNGIQESLDHFRLLGAKYFIDLGEDKEAIRMILQIERPAKFELYQRLALANHLMEFNELERGLEIAYDARLDNYNRAEAHELYISCCVGKKEQPNEILFPKSISMDCAVYLIDQSGGQQEFFLTDDERYQSATILRSGDKWTSLLIGKNLGDKISMPNSIGIGSILIINAILNKHVYAFRESGELLKTKFSGETKMQFLRLGDDDEFSVLHQFFKKQAIEAQHNSRAILKLYEEDNVTVGLLAYYFRRSFIEMWFALIQSSDTFLRCYTHDEQPVLSHALTNQQVVVIDPIALLTNLILLPDYNLLQDFAGRCVVAHATITELKNHKKQLEQPGPKGSIGIEDGELRKHDYTQEATDKEIELIDSIISWCEENTVVKSPVKQTKKPKGFKLDIVAAVGHAFHDTALLAKELNGVILSDDARFKSFAFGEFSVNAFSSYQVAVYKANNGSLSDSEYRSLSKSLMSANYGFIPISGPDLWALFEAGNFQLKPPFTRSVRGVRILSVPYCVFTLATFAKLLYLNIAVTSLREQAMLYVLQEAKRNTNFSEIKQLLLIVVEREFHLMPTQKSELQGLIRTLSVQI